MTEVFDGDTIKLSNGEIVRYLGIDTPELHKKKDGRWEKAEEPYALKAYLLNKSLVAGKPVRLLFDKEQRDHYGRLLCYVFAGDVFVNETLVREGLAFLYTSHQNTLYRDRLVKAFFSAFNARKNIFSQMPDKKEINVFTGREIWYRGRVNQVLSGGKTVVISDDMEVVLKGASFKKGIRKGANIYAYGRLSRTKSRYQITVEKPSHFFSE